MRELSASAAALVRSSICSVTCSARPTSNCSKRPMRLSRLLATSTARVPSDLSISSIRSPMVSASLAPRVLMTPVTSSMRLVERGDDLLAAFGQRLGDVHDARGEGVVEGLGAAVERFLEARQALVEGRGDLGRLGADLAVEAVDVVVHRGRDFGGALAETFDQLAAVGLHGAVELGEVAGDEVAEGGGVAGDLLGELGAAVREHLLERLQAGRPASRAPRRPGSRRWRRGARRSRGSSR